MKASKIERSLTYRWTYKYSHRHILVALQSGSGHHCKCKTHIEAGSCGGGRCLARLGACYTVLNTDSNNSRLGPAIQY